MRSLESNVVHKLINEQFNRSTTDLIGGTKNPDTDFTSQATSHFKLAQAMRQYVHPPAVMSVMEHSKGQPSVKDIDIGAEFGAYTASSKAGV